MRKRAARTGIILQADALSKAPPNRLAHATATANTKTILARGRSENGSPEFTARPGSAIRTADFVYSEDQLFAVQRQLEDEGILPRL